MVPKTGVFRLASEFSHVAAAPRQVGLTNLRWRAVAVTAPSGSAGQVGNQPGAWATGPF